MAPRASKCCRPRCFSATAAVLCVLLTLTIVRIDSVVLDSLLDFGVPVGLLLLRKSLIRIFLTLIGRQNLLLLSRQVSDDRRVPNAFRGNSPLADLFQRGG